MAVLIDTNALVFLATGSARLSQFAQRVLTDPARTLLVSAITTFEYADLNRCGEFGAERICRCNLYSTCWRRKRWTCHRDVGPLRTGYPTITAIPLTEC